jgi:hypothetical protein
MHYGAAIDHERLRSAPLRFLAGEVPHGVVQVGGLTKTRLLFRFDSVSIPPGPMQFTVIFGPSSRASAHVRLCTASFDAPYAPAGV